MLAPRRPALYPLAWALATVGGVGHSPVAPGTLGTAVAVPLALLLSLHGHAVYLLGLLGAVGLGIWSAEVVDEAWETHDSRRVVLDEVAGYLLTMAAVPRSVPNLVVGFLLFRLFDVWKPAPLDRLEALPGGLGVVADDLGAGAYAALLLLAVDRSGAVGMLANYFGSFT